MTAQELRNRTLKDLGRLARQQGVAGWHAMRKDDLVKALSRLLSRKSARRIASLRSVSSGKTSSHAGKTSSAAPRLTAAKSSNTLLNRGAPRPSSAIAGRNGHAKGSLKRPHTLKRQHSVNKQHSLKREHITQRIRQAQQNQDRRKNLATSHEGNGDGRLRDRLVVMVRDPYWLQVYWEISRQGVDRARAAMGQDWHAAKPVLRLMEVGGGEGTSSVERLLRDIPIHGGVNNWYVDVKDPPKTYRLDIGYLAAGGRFFALARSNVVTTPRAGTSDVLDNNWSDVAENFEKIYAMNGGASDTGASAELEELFEERLRRPLNVSAFSQYAAGINGHRKQRDFKFEVDAELIVFGCTEPSAQVTLQGEPIDVRSDGSFTVRFSLPNCRQVIPAVACSRDGIEQRTIVLAVERNTKTMEPITRDGSE